MIAETKNVSVKKSEEEKLVDPHSKNVKIPLPTKEGYIFISSEDIIRCEANGKTSICILKSYVQKELLLSFKQTEELLKKHGFFRVHHSHLINMNHIEKYVKKKSSGGQLTMSSGEIVIISKRKKKGFIHYLKAV